jgi:hypothetical protein
MKRLPLRLALAALLAACLAAAASAATPYDASGYTPRVPVSALGLPTMIDPTQLHFSTSVSFGSGFGGTNGLQVTSMSYQFKMPLAMRVSVGNTWGPAAMGNNKMFLEGLDLTYSPFRSMQLNIQYRDIRSPLQLDGYGYGYPYRAWH